MIRRILMSLNDPQWGRRGSSQGPPDLDEIWRNFIDKLGRLFGRNRGGGGGGEPGGPDARAFGAGALALLGVVVLIWLFTGFYRVVEGERGIVLRFGKRHLVTGSGLRWRLPYPVESHEIVNMSQVRTVSIGAGDRKESLMVTGDQNVIQVQFAVQYLLKDPIDFLFKNRRPEETVEHVAESAMREIVGRSKMDAVLNEDRENIAASASKLMQAILDRYGTGVEISLVTLQNAQPPERVKAAFDDALAAQSDRERQKNEGEAYANDIVPKARGAAARMDEEAKGYRQQVIAAAEGDASRFKQILAEYSRAPGVTRERMYLDMMQQILGNSTKVLVDTRSGGNLLYLPLDKMIQSGAFVPSGDAAQGARPAAPPAGEPSPASPDSGARSRDALRNRDRDAR